MFHTFDHLQTCKLFTLFFFQSIGDISGESFVSGDGDVFQRIGTLLGFFDVGGKTDCCIFDHGELDGQLFYTLEGGFGLVQGQLGAVVGVGRSIAGFFIVFHKRDLSSHDTPGLDPDGIFIFDMNTPYKYREMLGNTTIAENREEGSFIWENEFDEETGINVYDLTLFLPREDGLYERDEEIHYQKAYDPEKVRELLEKAGLIPLAVYDAYTKDAPKPDSGRLTFVAREHGKEIPSDEK